MTTYGWLRGPWNPRTWLCWVGACRQRWCSVTKRTGMDLRTLPHCGSARAGLSDDSPSGLHPLSSVDPFGSSGLGRPGRVPGVFRGGECRRPRQADHPGTGLPYPPGRRPSNARRGPLQLVDWNAKRVVLLIRASYCPRTPSSPSLAGHGPAGFHGCGVLGVMALAAGLQWLAVQRRGARSETQEPDAPVTG